MPAEEAPAQFDDTPYHPDGEPMGPSVARQSSDGVPAGEREPRAGDRDGAPVEATRDLVPA